MNSTTYAADLAETSPPKSVGALRLAAAVGFVLLSTAFTVHSFVVSTQPWQPEQVPEMGANTVQEAPIEWDLNGSGPIELSLVSPACVDCELEVPGIALDRNEG